MKLTKYIGFVGGLAFAAAMTGCAEADLLQPGNDGNVVVNVTLPHDFTRATDGTTLTFGDGSAINELKCYVYDSSYEQIAVVDGDLEGLTGKVTLPLVSGETYKLVFWADKATDAAAGFTSPYSISTKGVLSVDYSKVEPNNDDYDAFYFAQEFKANPNTKSVDITLNRPFAQINFGALDAQ